ncbi:anti-sigma-I factor RsgI family protein [Virgibacillus oceani]|uniref:Anti-sigma-I factor RsgI n=1 Tax=Virgibacillus oceani TaxID=1479511 RepID=A0A917HPF3_9BACI|nr:anti-sigma factor domain-containing protein [Virgibacillus oceani]GGG85411.1 anti-sigma-I factor RsgI [Virgibacillus oceani]
MKKAIVMEKHRRYTIVLTQDGNFQKAKPVKNAAVGAEVSYEIYKENEHLLFFFHPSKVNKSFRLIAMACLLLLIVMPFYFISNSSKTYAYVNVDINPSIELEIGEDLKVRSILPLNDDAKKLVKELTHYKSKPLDEVLSDIMDKSEEKGLIKNGKNVLVGVSYVDSNTHKRSVLNTIDSYFLDHHTDWKTATFSVPKEIRENAKEQETSMNKLMAESFREENSLNDDTDISKQDQVNDEEKAIINSFYNNRSDNADPVDSKEKSEKASEKASEEKQHSSKHKEKNGQLNSNQKNSVKQVKANNGKGNAKAKKMRETRVKHNKGKNNNHKKKANQKHKKYKHNKHDNGKHKGKNKGKHKGNYHKKHHDQGHNKHKNKRNHGHGHR